MSIQDLYSLYKKHPKISTDTRNIQSDSLFFALKGDHFNGNTFADNALTAGASYVIIDEAQYKKDDRFILVSNVLESLQELAKYHRKQLKIPVIGITGTNGKTTTKELIKAVLAEKFRVLATKGNLNNHIGVPLTLLSITNDIEIAIIEMGANHIGEIGFLCSLCQPTHGIITNVGLAHLEGFGSFEGVKTAKGELYNYLEKVNGILFINNNNSHLIEMSSGVKEFTSYGNLTNSDIKGELMSGGSFTSLKWFAKNEKTIHQVQSNLVGDYNFENILAAICIGNFFKVSPEKIENGIKNYIPSNNRSQLIKKGSNSIIMDAYNANPSSMKVAIENLDTANSNHKIAILGDMFEMGKESETEHKKILTQLAKSQIHQKIVVGKEFCAIKNIPNDIRCFKNIEELIIHLSKEPIANALILIKGSRGMKMETILDTL